MKIAILFNCQHLGLANAMRALRPDLQIQSFVLVSFNSAEAREKLLAQLEGVETIIASGLLGSDWGVLSAESLRAKGYKYFVLPGIAFSGFHPDTVYVTGPSGNYGAATGGYHSRIAIAGFLAGLPVGDTVALFNKLVFSRLGYFDAFPQSRQFLINQFKTIGVDLTPHIDAWTARGCFMHSANHPKIHVLCDLAVIAHQLIGLEMLEERAHLELIPDSLAFHVQMPVYPELARPLGVEGHSMFKAISGGGIYQFLPLETYVRSCFKYYESGPRDLMLKANGVSDAMQKLGLEVKKLECTA